LSRIPLPRQAVLIAQLQQHPGKNYLFYGAAETGKTHLAAALYANKLARWARRGLHCDKPPRRLNVPSWLDQMVAKSTDPEAPNPAFVVAQVGFYVNNGLLVELFLDELDKFRVTDFKLAKLLELITAVSDQLGQIVATSNASPQELVALWGKNYAEPILRRVGGPPEGSTYEFQV
jgi:predicted ATPase